MTALYFQTLRSGRRRAWRFLADVAREEVRLACGNLRFHPGGGRWFRNRLLKRRHPGGGECRHLIYDPKPREEVKRWVVSGSAIFWEEQADPNSVLRAVSGFVGDVLYRTRRNAKVRKIAFCEAFQFTQGGKVDFALGYCVAVLFTQRH